jgi:hypothetical protein
VEAALQEWSDHQRAGELRRLLLDVTRNGVTQIATATKITKHEKARKILDGSVP